MRIIVRSSVALFAETLCVMAARFERRGQSASWTLSRLPRALAYLPSVERRISSAWFSMREIADFFVRSFFAMASCVIPAFSLACRSMTLNWNASYPDSKFSANFDLRFLRFRMYRSTSLMASSFFVGNRICVEVLFGSRALVSIVAFWKTRWSESTRWLHRKTPGDGNCCRPFGHEFPRGLPSQRVS